jgi:hypothetical protein
MTAFAEFSDLQALLGDKITEGQQEQVEALLEAASAHLRHIIGQNVYPQETVTYEAYPSFGREDLPQWPVVRVDAVKRGGVDVDYTYRPGFVMVSGDDPVDITFTYGVADAPAELKRLTCVLAAQALQMLATTGALTAGGLSSLGIDDFRAAFADAGEGTGISVPKHVEAGLRRRFGRGGVDVIEAAW